MKAGEAIFETLKDLRQFANTKNDRNLTQAVEAVEKAVLSEIFHLDVQQDDARYDALMEFFFGDLAFDRASSSDEHECNNRHEA